MSSWKDSSDFASLAAALSKAKAAKSVENKPSDTVQVLNSDLKIEELKVDESVSPKRVYTDFDDEALLSSRVPVKEFFSFKQHKSTVSALEFEVSGSRFLSGSHDTTVAYWDFNGMVRDRPEPFRFIEPMGSYPIRSLKYSRDSQWVLMAASSCSAKLFDRNGSQVREYGKGDPYIRDLKHTTGHVAGITTALWLPHDEDRFLTASEDGTLRIWHIGQRHKSESVLTVKSSVAGTGGRSAITCANFGNISSESLLLATGSADGSIKLWDGKALSGGYPIGSIDKAHIFGEKISSISFSRHSSDLIASRCTDGTAKLWDRRKFTQPVLVYEDLPTLHAETSILFMKDKILTGSADGLVCLDSTDASLRHTFSKSPSPSSAVVTLVWNEKTEQILLGHSDGHIEIVYDESIGNGKGALLMRQRSTSGQSRIDGEVDVSAGGIYSSSGTGIYDSSARAPSKRKLDKIRADPVKSHRPELPAYGPGQGGKIGSNVTQTIMKNVLKDTSRDVDPRAALLAYAEKAAKNPKFVTPAYQETQPQAVFDASLLEKEAAVEEEKKRKLEEVERLQAEKEKISNRFKQ